WLFGNAGCQFYAFMGFLFGSANIGTLALIALDRYAVTCRCEIRGRLTYGRYCHLIGLVWLSSTFWASMPLLGWSRYNYEPSLTTCTIDWRHNTGGYRSFLLVYFVLWYLVPLGIIFFCYWHAAKSIRRGRASPRDHYCYDWANESNVTLMCFLLVVSFAVCWSGYAVVCLWTVFLPPDSVPFILTLLPPLLAKTYPVINPMIFFVCNTRIRRGMQITMKRLFCQKLNDDMVIEEPAPNTSHPECAAIVAQDGGTILCRKCSYCRRQDCKTIVY
ncbi:visual pigment-like receptor peropsin, partial [Amphibalanus amphitrite]|uniref:visual pigment-like receptor peropsin n=1 Tax=Amphibalanus amphitrite TaxID=1232801 RepID=UPI001C8FA84F